MADLIKPKEFEIELPEGGTQIFILSKIPAVEAREIICQYPLTSIPKIGDYKSNEDIMMKLMNYVAVPLASGVQQRLTTRQLINNHLKSEYQAILLMKIEDTMFFYNYGFFLHEKVSNFFDGLAQRVAAWATSISTASSPQSSTQAKPPSTNSGQSTT